MLMLCEWVKFIHSSPKSALDFLQVFKERSVSSGKELKILLSEEILGAARSLALFTIAIFNRESALFIAFWMFWIRYFDLYLTSTSPPEGPRSNGGCACRVLLVCPQAWLSSLFSGKSFS